MNLTTEQLQEQLELKTKELAAANQELLELRQYKEETVWRLTVDDFMIKHLEKANPDFDEDLYEYGRELNDSEKELIDLAKERFNIDDWSEWVTVWLDIVKQ